MPTRYGCCTHWLHYNVDHPLDLKELIDNGLIWRGSRSMQEKAVRAILAGDAQPNDQIPPKIAEYIREQQ